MGEAVLPACWLSGLRQPRPVVHRLRGGADYTLQGGVPGLLPPVSAPRWARPDPRPRRRPSTTAGSFASVSSAVSAPFLLSSVPWCAQDSVCPPRTEGCSLHSRGSPISNPAGIKVRFPGESPSLCWIPRLGSPTLGLEPSHQWENFFRIIVLGRPPGGCRICFYRDRAPPTVLLWLLFFRQAGSVVGGFQCLPADQQLAAMVALSQEEMSTHPSTLPSWTERI